MEIRIPVSDVLSKPSSVEISEVELHLRPNAGNLSHIAFEKHFRDLLIEQAQEAVPSDDSPSQDDESTEDNYDHDKMNDLKKLLLQVLLQVNADVKDVVIKVFLQAEAVSAGATKQEDRYDPYVMLRVSSIKRLKLCPSSLLFQQ